MLGLQLMMFYLPDVIWRSLTYNKLGINLNTLIQESLQARSAPSVSKRREMTNHVAESLRLVLFDHRNVKQGVWVDMKNQLGRLCGFLILSKRLGTWTVASYFLVKLVYIANAVGQLYLMRHFLGFDTTKISAFGFELARRIRLTDDWKNSLYFPRAAFCRVEIKLLGAENQYVALCALPVNLFNEKIYMFLWFWVAFVCTCTVISLPMWIWSLCLKSKRVGRLHHYFRIDDLNFDEHDMKLNPFHKNPHNKQHLGEFVDEFLRYDGCFILEIVNNHVGDVVTGEIVRLLWTAWVKEYAGRHDFRRDDWSVAQSLMAEKEATMSNFSPQSSLSRYPTLNRPRPSSVKSGVV
ncbi:Innexin inx2 [Cichlidogyrus casuarinus]|uniref:Innexin n=1 Tax=Cichlidogyrus casuarinus TaxID=1844966 RepID=A0ABD2PJ78_9PLAT